MNANLISLRMKQCPYYPGLKIQQIIGYGHKNKDIESDYSGDSIALNPFLIIFAKLFEPYASRRNKMEFRSALSELIKKNLGILKSSLKNELYNSDTILDNEFKLLKDDIALKVVNNRGKNVHILFSPIDWKELAESRSIPLRTELRKYYPYNEGRLGFDKTKFPSSKPLDFALAVCIRDEPGTLHSVLKSLTHGALKASEPQDPFCFNIDYLISEYLGIFNLYHIQLYGSYIKENAQIQNADKSKNILGVTFFHRSEDDIPEKWNEKIKLKRISSPKSNIQQHLQHLGLTGDKKHSSNVGISAFHRAESSIFDDIRFGPVLNCPGSRVAGCPEIDPSLISPTSKVHDKEKFPVKFHLIMQDQPGALQTFIKLVGRGKLNLNR